MSDDPQTFPEKFKDEQPYSDSPGKPTDADESDAEPNETDEQSDDS